MPRKPRFNLVGVPQHIIQRGNNREACFHTENDYRHYLDDLRFSSFKYECCIHAYVLMTNHVHLLVTPMAENSVSQMMQSLGSRYVRYFNQQHNRTGTLWEGRFKSSLIDSEIYLLTCMCYIELNPVRAGMVTHPGNYKWSSYGGNAQLRDDDIIQRHPVYMSLGETTDERRFVYRELFQQHLDDDTIHQIRDVLNHEIVLGSSSFKDKIEKLTRRKTRLGRPGRPCVRDEHAGYAALR